MGFYFARARVHETGPYGDNHCAFQHHGRGTPTEWPIRASIELMLNGAVNQTAVGQAEWQLWRSRVDEWGASFSGGDGLDRDASQREAVWRELSLS